MTILLVLRNKIKRRRPNKQTSKKSTKNVQSSFLNKVSVSCVTLQNKVFKLNFLSLEIIVVQLNENNPVKMSLYPPKPLFKIHVISLKPIYYEFWIIKY